MITDAILNILASFFNFMVNLLPKTGFSADVNTAVSGFFQNVYSYNSIFPVDTAINVIKWIFLLTSIILLWDFIKWVTQLIRGN